MGSKLGLLILFTTTIVPIPALADDASVLDDISMQSKASHDSPKTRKLDPMTSGDSDEEDSRIKRQEREEHRQRESSKSSQHRSNNSGSISDDKIPFGYKVIAREWTDGEMDEVRLLEEKERFSKASRNVTGAAKRFMKFLDSYDLLTKEGLLPFADSKKNIPFFFKVLCLSDLEDENALALIRLIQKEKDSKPNSKSEDTNSSPSADLPSIGSIEKKSKEESKGSSLRDMVKSEDINSSPAADLINNSNVTTKNESQKDNTPSTETRKKSEEEDTTKKEEDNDKDKEKNGEVGPEWCRESNKSRRNNRTNPKPKPKPNPPGGGGGAGPPTPPGWSGLPQGEEEKKEDGGGSEGSPSGGGGGGSGGGGGGGAQAIQIPAPGPFSFLNVPAAPPAYTRLLPELNKSFPKLAPWPKYDYSIFKEMSLKIRSIIWKDITERVRPGRY